MLKELFACMGRARFQLEKEKALCSGWGQGDRLEPKVRGLTFSPCADSSQLADIFHIVSGIGSESQTWGEHVLSSAWSFDSR